MASIPASGGRLCREVSVDALDFAALLRAGDRLVIGQMAGEPLSLGEALTAQRASLPEIEIFLGVQQVGTFGPEATDHLRFASFGAMDKTARLACGGGLDIVPESLGGIGRNLLDGTMPCDVVLLQLAPGGGGRSPSFGVTNDVLPAAMRRARLVVAEVNAQAPWTFNDRHPVPDEIDILVHTSRPLPEVQRRPAGPVEQAIAAECARFVTDGCCLQVGIGGIPDALLPQLADRRDLGFHSGMISNGAAHLMRTGVITNTRKGRDKGISVAAMASGNADLYAFLHGNPAVRIDSSLYTHACSVIASLDRFVAINSVLEVDLFGAVNSEAVGGRWIGGAGGLPDFVAGALAAPGGRSIIALPAATVDGKASRIVGQLNGPTTLPRSMADVVVTEYGYAELRGQSLRERARRMIEVAAPEWRETLAQHAHAMNEIS